MSTPGSFFGEHRKAIDARKAHLARVGIHSPDESPLRDAMPSQADILTPPLANEPPLLDATHKAVIPGKPPAAYDTPKLPKLPGVNAKAEE